MIPPPEASPLENRELLYTAITRAKKEAAVWRTPEVFKSAVNNTASRSSGLMELLTDSGSETAQSPEKSFENLRKLPEFSEVESKGGDIQLSF